MNTRTLLSTALLLALTSGCTTDDAPTPEAEAPAAPEDAEPEPPANSVDDGTLSLDGSHNILLIIADDLGVDNVGAYGEHDDSASTPNIDALADSGVLFRNAWTNPMCSPTRASILTGRHAYNHEVLYPSNAELDTDEETFAEVLQDVGYRTALFGKWHLGTAEGTTPIGQGFHYFAGADSNLDDFFEWTKHTMRANDGTDIEETSSQYATAVNVADAKQWLNQVSGNDAPWMAVMAFNAPHSPFHVPPPSLYSGVTLDGDVGDSCDDTVDAKADCYRAAAEAVDTKIGELLTFIDGLGELDNTLVIFIGDNGTPGNVIIDDGVFSTDHGKTTPYEGGVNVPFIVYGPAIGVQQGVELSELVLGLDIFSTVLAVGGGTAANTIDSESLVEHITGEDITNPRETVYTELYSAPNDIDRWTITNGSAKYIYNDGSEECYNLNRDPGESSEKYASEAPITETCDELKLLRPCLDSDACPGS